MMSILTKITVITIFAIFTALVSDSQFGGCFIVMAYVKSCGAAVARLATDPDTGDIVTGQVPHTGTQDQVCLV